MTKVLILFVIAILVFLIGPCATIWSLNTLFPSLAIPLNFDTWCAALILSGVVSGGFVSASSKN
jgi:hypothetical protein